MDSEVNPKPKEIMVKFKITPSLMIITFIITYYLLFASLGVVQTTEDNTSSKGAFLIVEIIMWSVFVLLIIINSMIYLFNIDIVASFQNLFSQTPTIIVTP
jgi:hypothetical protein